MGQIDEQLELEEPEFSRTGLFLNRRESIPAALGVFTYGIIFGVLARQPSLEFIEAVLMSA